MKKFVKPLVIASSVAAVVGIGAVSFAAWTGNDTSDDATATTGSLETYGISVKTNGLDSKVWVPYDQDLTNNPITNGVNVWDITIKTDGEATADTTYELHINYVAADTHANMQNCMYVYIGSSYTAPDESTSIDFDTTTDWQKITGSATKIENFTVADDAVVHVIFDSDVIAQMGKDVKLTLTLEKAST